jgi:hypothetical protein
VSGDLITNSISDIGTNGPSGNSGTLALGPFKGDAIYIYDATSPGSGQNGYSTPGYSAGYSQQRNGTSSWNGFGSSLDPTTPNVSSGFWYFSATNVNNNWVENFTINP